MKKIIFTAVILFLVKGLFAQSLNDKSIEKRYFVGSTLFMIANLVDDPEPPNYYQLNLGYRITEKDVVSLELITWNYYEPLGIPWNKKKTAPNFSGKVQALGAGFAYKRFLWKKAYAQVHSTALRQNYLDESDNKIQRGFQLFNTVRIGYQFRFFKNRIFVEPSIGTTFWPVNTNLPESFQVEEDKWNKYFLGEPGIHFGFNF
jgi:hypothetical protein